MAAKSKTPDNTYGIGAVAKITGLTDHTIRVWERRYRAVVTKRLTNGRRVFTAADVEKLGLLKALTDRGMAISSIARQSIDELRAQARESGEIASSLVPAGLRAAVIGDFLPEQLRMAGDEGSAVEITVADSDPERFIADIKRHEIDVVVMETAVLDAASLRQFAALLRAGQSARGVLVYRFGRTSDVEKARASNIVLLRSPVTTDELLAAVVRACATRKRTRKRPVPVAHESQWRFDGPVAPRRFTPQQLSSLANITSTVECECPQQLAELVGDLTAFEVYSGNCASKNDEDAALHRYLHQTTAQARALIEEALERVAVAEGLRF